MPKAVLRFQAKIGLIAFLGLWLGLLTACGAPTVPSQPSANPTSPALATTSSALPTKIAGQPVEIRLITANHPWQVAIEKLIPEFERATGIKVKLESYFEDQLSQKLQIGLTSGASGADLFMYRPLQEGKLFANNNWLADLTAQVETNQTWNWLDFQASPRSTVTFDNKVFGVPLVTEREIVYYRKDLFEQNNLQPPATLDDLLNAAKKLHDPEKGLNGIVMRGQRSAAVTQFSSFLYSQGGEWVKDGKSALTTPAALSAYKIYGDLLRNYGPQGTLNMSWPQAVAIFQQGKAAMWIDADSLYTNLLDTSKSTVADKVGYAQFPAGTAGSKPYNVTSWAVGMNNSSEKKAAAWEFIKWATSPQIVLQLQQGGLPGARTSVWEAPEGLKGFPAEYAKVAKASAKVGVGFDRPPVINVGQARDIVGEPIVVSIQGGDVTAALAGADQKFNAFLQTDKATK
jgi:multiple sugar transport system substrate-binding protein